MPFKETKISDEIEKMKNDSPAFTKTWDDCFAEYELIGEMISLRRKENLTQKQLAKLAGIKSKKVAQIEGKECSPSLRDFCKILDAMGYELKIVKK